MEVTVGEGGVEDLDAFSDKVDTGIKSSRSLDAIFLFFLFLFFSQRSLHNLITEQQISSTLPLKSSYQLCCVVCFTFYFSIISYNTYNTFIISNFNFFNFYYILCYNCTRNIILYDTMSNKE